MTLARILGLFHIEIDRNRVFGLDILRAAAILLVLIAHARYVLPKHGDARAFHQFIMVDGVTLFFVLSGFLIGGILLRNLERYKLNWAMIINFWVRRWLRTLPNYFLILTLLIVLSVAFADLSSSIDHWKYFLFSQNIFHPQPPFFPESWSLSVEEWFYLLIPILLLLAAYTTRISPKFSVLFCAILVLIAVTAFRYYRFSIIEFEDVNVVLSKMFRKQVSTRLDSIMYGMLGAWMYFYHPIRWPKQKRLFFVTGIILLAVNRDQGWLFQCGNDLYKCVFSFSVDSLATLFLLPLLSEWKTGNGFFFRVITYISLTSYSMYLINYSLLQGWFIHRIPWGWIEADRTLIVISNYGLFWTMTVALSILNYKYFEVPVIKVRDSPLVKSLLPNPTEKTAQNEG